MSEKSWKPRATRSFACSAEIPGIDARAVIASRARGPSWTRTVDVPQASQVAIQPLKAFPQRRQAARSDRKIVLHRGQTLSRDLNPQTRQWRAMKGGPASGPISAATQIFAADMQVRR